MADKRKRKLTPEQRMEVVIDAESLAWWTKDGRYYDPDTDDVDWFDKRRELAMVAFRAGFMLGKDHASTNGKEKA